MKKRNIRNKILVFVISAIILLAFIFRFYNLSSWIFFGMDQEYEALIVKNILTGKHFPLIGVNAGDTGLYLGPFFIYFATIPFALFSGNPVGWAITASAIGIFVCCLIYKIGKEMFSQKTGVFASLFYAGSFLTSFYDRKFWNPTLLPLFSLFMGFLLYLILKRKQDKLIWLSFVSGIAIQCHLSMLIFIPLIIYVLWIRRKAFSKKIIILSIAVFILLQTPLIIFELRHGLINSKAFINLFINRSQQNVSTSTIRERNTLFISTLGRFFWIPASPDLFLESGQCKQLLWLRRNASPEGILLVISGLGIFLWWYFHKKIMKKSENYPFDFTFASKIVLGIIILTIFFVQVYNRAFFEYYLLFFFPWLSIILGRSVDFLLNQKHGEMIVYPVIILFISLNFLTLFTSSFSYSYKDKLAAINFAKRYIHKDTYVLEALGECSRFGGYRYLMEYFVSVPIRSYMDSYFSWLYSAKIRNNKPEKLIILSMIDSRDEPELIAKWEEAKFQLLNDFEILAEGRFGKIQVLILNPS